MNHRGYRFVGADGHPPEIANANWNNVGEGSLCLPAQNQKDDCMTITARPYTDNDLPQLQITLSNWIQQAGDCGYCHIGELSHRIYSGLSDLVGIIPIGELVQVWEDESSIAGIAINLRFENAFEVYTSPVYRGTEAEVQMLQTA